MSPTKANEKNMLKENLVVKNSWQGRRVIDEGEVTLVESLN